MIINSSDRRGSARAPGQITSNFQLREIDSAMRTMVVMVIIITKVTII